MQSQMFKRILFIGLGGAGQRHLRLFKENSPKETELIAYRSTSKTPVLNPDFTVNNSASLEELYGVKIFESLDQAISSGPDLAVISTPSSLHVDYAQLCAEKGINIFIEKPLSHTLQGLKKLKDTILSNQLFLQVGFQRRYHPYLARIHQLIESGTMGSITNVIINVASYVPHWHPYENYKDLYACRKDLGGGVLLTEIHEFDLCVWYFGKPMSVTCVGGTYSDVGLDVEDTVHATLDYEEFSIQVNLTFWQKNVQRSIFIAGEDKSTSWNQEGNILQIFDHTQQTSEINKDLDMSNDLMFDLQIKDLLSNHNPAKSSLNMLDSSLSLSIVMAAKQSMEENRTVNLD